MNGFDDINLLRIQRGTGKVCGCYSSSTFTIDPECRKVFCNECGAEVDPFDAIYRVARYGHELHERVDYLRKELKEVSGKLARTTLFRRLESKYWPHHGVRMLPHCPQCNTPFRFEELSAWSNEKHLAEVQARIGQKEGNANAEML